MSDKNDDILGALRDHLRYLDNHEERLARLEGRVESHQHKIVDKLQRFTGPPLEPQIDPQLGYATTKQLLEELSARLHLTSSVVSCHWLGDVCDAALKRMPEEVLKHRTVDS